MLEIRKITKEYNTDGFKQKALNSVSINFRNCEFASILGPSGSGKTTFLNIVGGLDTYDSGDLIINEVSTKKYKDKDWDTYRNHRVGFVFQSYNLISHQSILQNVELALTLSGVSKHERRRRAKKALESVGLEKHINKRPNQLSGGQMQRVAIARALVNNPEILLADEPTGALDSTTSEQIMKLLKEIAKDRLVIMVTHNPELAMEYSTRIIKLKDGKIIDDTNPYDGKVDTSEEIEKGNLKNKKTSMNLWTALGLSLNNLMTKKGRTILTSFAGSIGIIGIALILALSNGVEEYIDKTEKETLSSYPIQIETTSLDLSAMIGSMKGTKEEKIICSEGKICTTDDISNSRQIRLDIATIKNNLENFKKFLDNNGGNIKNYTTDIGYIYNLDLQIYSANTEKITKVNPNTFTLTKEEENNDNMTMSQFQPSNNVFNELINNEELLNSEYKILSGRLQQEYNEMVLIVDKDNQLPLSVMYSLDIENRDELTSIIDKIKKGEDIKLDSVQYDYSTILNNTFKLVLNTDYFEKQNNIWINKSNDTDYMKKIINNGLDIKIVGVLKVNEESSDITSGYIGYLHELTEYVINKTNEQEIVKEQQENKNINIFTGKPFDGLVSTYDINVKTLGITQLDNPKTINIYPKDFDSKEKIETIIEDYNTEQTKNGKEENVITYTDMIGILLSSVTSIVNIISYVLIAFVAVSLIVSSIMIAIITYISVLERTKEIGILRAIGASKKDIRRVFNAETIIEGLVAGCLGVGIAYLLTIPANAIIKEALGVSGITHLRLDAGIILILISIFLTVIAGLIPANMASKKDPVESLRSE